MMGFQSSAMKFAHFFFLCEAVVFAGTSLLIFCGCCARDFEMANNYATVFFCLFMMFDGSGLCGNRPVRRVHRQFFIKPFLGDDAAVLAPPSGGEPVSPRLRAGVASMAWRTTR